MVPAAFLNHGFYNFNALLFGDYYRQSGWHEEKLFYLVTPKVPLTGQEVYARVPPDLLIDVPPGCFVNVFGWFRKTETTTNPIAVQGLYLGLHEAWNHQSRDMSTHIRPEGALTPQPGWWERARTRFRQALAVRHLRRLPGGDVIRYGARMTPRTCAKRPLGPKIALELPSKAERLYTVCDAEGALGGPS
jgi:hypothetical protein